ncbi:MAG: methyltransferase domain-containing protein [Candidatus Rokubacteria bacterium]|nr:methyltransferase domain-containing protein [Candidatus Rokubacteria bacterium]
MVTAMPREAHRLERLDRPMPPEDLATSLADIERLNAWFGGHRLTLGEVTRRLAGLPRDRRILVLDVGGGRGDFARHLAGWARRERRSLRVLVLDRDGPTAALARRHCADMPEITVVQGDATALPFREDSVDVAVSVLTLHHLDPDGATAMLAEMRAAARDALVVNDLLRGRVAWLAVWLTTRCFARHPASRHDGPLSVRRSYSVRELETLAQKARLGRVTIRRVPWLVRTLLCAP